MLLTARTGWIGLDLGSRSVKVAQLRRRGSQYELLGAASLARSQPWDGSAWQDALPLCSQDEIAAVRGACGFLRGRSAACVLPMAACEHRQFQVGDASDAAIGKAIEAELASDPITSQRSFEFDVWYGESGEAGVQNAGVLAAPQSFTEQVMHDHVASRLRCKALDGLPFALARAMHLTTPQERRPLAALDWGYRSATFCIVQDGAPVFIRTLRNCEFSRLIEALSQGIGLDAEDAESLLLQTGVTASRRRIGSSPGADPGESALAPLSEMLQEPLEQMLAELERTLSFLGSHQRKLLPASLILFGGGACVPHVAEWLAEHTGLAAQPWRLTSAIRVSKETLLAPEALLGPAIALSALAWEA